MSVRCLFSFNPRSCRRAEEEDEEEEEEDIQCGWNACSQRTPSPALSAPLVPTATNPGVSMTPCGVWMRPTRAADFVL